MKNEQSKYITSEEACEKLGIKRATLYSYVSRGIVRRIKTKDNSGSLYLYSDVKKQIAKLKSTNQKKISYSDILKFGNPILQSSISRIVDGELFYRELLMNDLVKRSYGFESVAEYLWKSSVPSKDIHWEFNYDLIPSNEFRLNFDNTNLFSFTLELLLHINSIVTKENDNDSASTINLLKKIIFLTAFYLSNSTSKNKFTTIAEIIANRLGIDHCRRNISIVNSTLVICAEHELTNSTFTSRIVKSSDASLIPCIISAACSFSGGKHGGVCSLLNNEFSKVVNKDISLNSENEFALVKKLGFEHHLYPNGDPRAKLLIDFAKEIDPKNERFIKMLEIERFFNITNNSYANLDFGLLALATVLKVPIIKMQMIFFIGRIAGWGAHILEQMDSREILRPRAEYIKIGS